MFSFLKCILTHIKYYIYYTIDNIVKYPMMMLTHLYILAIILLARGQPHRVVDGLHMAGRLEKGSHLWTWTETRGRCGDAQMVMLIYVNICYYVCHYVCYYVC